MEEDLKMRIYKGFRFVSQKDLVVLAHGRHS